MQFKNTPDKYGAVAKSFHWIMGTIVIGMLAVGMYMVRQDPSPDVYKLYGLHKSFGLMILALIGLRLSWRLFSKPPELLEKDMKFWEVNAAKTVHAILYFAMFLMPLTGWAMSSAKNFPVSFFGLFQLPNIVPQNDRTFELYNQIHELLGYTLAAVVSVHILAALKHHFINKDKTLRRMLPFGALALMIAVTSSSFASDNTLEAKPNWIVQKDQSHIKFISKQMGAEFEGEFQDFYAAIYFYPDDLSASYVTVEVPIESVTTKSSERDEKIVNTDWFNAIEYPTAHFSSTNISKSDDGSYIAKGTLEVKGVNAPIELPFTLDISGDTATMQSDIILQRLDWNLGEGDWADTSFVGNDVKLNIHITAKTNPPPTQ